MGPDFAITKSKIIHHVPKTDYSFKLGDINLSKLEEYEYLGIVINECNDYNVTANRALGSVINKYKSINGLGYYTYTRLFQSGVCPILDYCS